MTTCDCCEKVCCVLCVVNECPWENNNNSAQCYPIKEIRTPNRLGPQIEGTIDGA